MVVLFTQCEELDIKVVPCSHSRKINIGMTGAIDKKQTKVFTLKLSVVLEVIRRMCRSNYNVDKKECGRHVNYGSC